MFFSTIYFKTASHILLGLFLISVATTLAQEKNSIAKNTITIPLINSFNYLGKVETKTPKNDKKPLQDSVLKKNRNFNISLIPTFTGISKVTTGLTLPPLPNTLSNDLSGTLLLTSNNLATTTFTIIPTAGQSVITKTMKTVFALPTQIADYGNFYVQNNGQLYVAVNQYNLQPIVGNQAATTRTSNFGKISFADPVVVVGSSATRFINGYVRKYGLTPIIYPLGNGTTFAPIKIIPTVANGIDAAYFASNPTTSPRSAILGIGFTAMSTAEYWHILRSNDPPISIANAKISLSWSAGVSSLNMCSLSDLTIIGWNNTLSKWELITSLYDATNIFTGTTSTLTAGSITSSGNIDLGLYQYFTFGSINTTASPTGIATQSFCNSATVSSLTTITGTGIQWYTASTGGTLLALTAALTNGSHYYASQTIVGCQSTIRLDVTAIINITNTASAASSIGTPFCSNTSLSYTHTTTGATGINSNGVSGANGLPVGVSASWATLGGGTITISGTPTVAGIYNYSIALTGGCGTVNATGTITVTITNTASAASSIGTPFCSNTSLSYTHTTTGATGINSNGVSGANGLPVGVSAAWATLGGGTITISGTPTVAGIYNYSIALTGGCGTVNATGTITVTITNTASAASSIGTPFCSNTSLSYTHTTTGATGINSNGVSGANGLPVGVSASWATLGGGTITISGTPTVAGIYNYSIALTGGCGTVNATGTITVTITNTASAASSIGTPFCSNTSLSYTHTTTGATGINSNGVSGANGLPVGVSASWATLGGGTITISGTPTVAGIYNYSIALTGGCGTVNATGTITVTIINTASAASSIGTPFCSNTSLSYTHTTTGATGINSNGVSGANGLPVGVSASWATLGGGTITISGTPTVAGIYNYSIALTGGCGTVNATGTITVTITNTASAASSIGTPFCSNTSLSYTHTTTGATGINSNGVSGANGLPVGVSASWATLGGGTITISGTPTVAGIYNYSIALTGGCGTVNATGTITVTITNTASAASSIGTPFCSNTSLSYTHTTTGATGINSNGVSGANGLPVGVSASWATLGGGTITISGTPTVAGIYNYSIALTGGCGTVNATGTITVTITNTASAASSIGTPFCSNTSLSYTHTTTGATGINSNGVSGANGLPVGVSAAWATLGGGTITISGTPTVAGIYNYSIALTGGCGTVNATGTITVTITNTASAASSIGTPFCSNTSLSYTHTTTGATGINSNGVSGANGLPVGVSAAWATLGGGTITISGTPTVAGIYNYSIALTGGCGTVNATGTITVTITNTASAASSIGTPFCSNTSLSYTHTTTGATGINSNGVSGANGLPVGVSAAWATLGGGTITISGTPTVAGIYNYSIALTGGCGTVNATGTITVTITNTASAASSIGTPFCSNTSLSYTHTTTGATGINSNGVSGANGLPVGVSAAWATLGGGTITISGTPTVAGIYNYSIALTGGCGTVNATGTITVTITNTASAASSIGTPFCSNTSLSYTHTTTGATGINSNGVSGANGLPVGVSAAWATLGGGTITISGTPTVAGIYNYSIALTGGCGTVNATGTITVTITNTASAASSIGTPFCSNTSLSYTHTTTGATGINSNGVSGANGLPVGVSASWATLGGGTITISGTPTVAGIYNYSIALTGGCGTVNATGTITVTITNTASVASSIGTPFCSNTSLSYTHTTTGATGINSNGVSGANGLPVGVSASWATLGGGTITISGTPTVAGIYNYSIALTGGCGTVNATGTITVTITNTASAASSIGTPFCSNTSLSYTHTTTGATGINSNGVSGANGLPVGVSAAWATLGGGTITISGTPTVAGIYNYSIALTGGCGTVNATGTITVTITNTASVASSIGTPFCSNTSLSYTHTTTGATGINSNGVSGANGLPVGVSASWATLGGGTITISGTPTVAGIYNYSIALTGGCGTVNATGRIEVKDSPSFTQVSPICSGATLMPLPTISNNYITGSWSPALNNTTTTTYTFTPTLGQCANSIPTTMQIQVNNPTVMLNSNFVANVFYDFSDNPHVIVEPNVGTNFSYQLDNQSPQNTNQFNNIDYGDHIIKISDSCSNKNIDFTVFGFPKFFTPNGDGINDYWTLLGNLKKLTVKIYIYDRYGKLIKYLDKSEPSWDGTINGTPSIATDYWFRIEYTINGSNSEFSSHFSLVR